MANPDGPIPELFGTPGVAKSWNGDPEISVAVVPLIANTEIVPEVGSENVP